MKMRAAVLEEFGQPLEVQELELTDPGPGEVLVSADVVSVSNPDGVRFHEIGPVELKGLSSPVTLYRVTGSPGGIG